MLAVRFHEHGGPEVMRLEEAPDPTPRPHELLLAVKAAGVNRADLLQREGRYTAESRFPATAGLEVCGEIIGMGDTVQGFRLGERVCGLLPGGGYAEKATMAAAMALRVPDNISAVEAAGIPVVFFTASETLFGRAQLKQTETAMVHAAGSGVGVAGIQLAKHRGARVITTAGSARKLERARELGADLAVNYNEVDFAAEALRFTENRGVDVIIDGVGAANFAGNLRSLAPGGRMVVVGFLGGGDVSLDLRDLVSKYAALHGFWLAGLGRALFPVVQQFEKEIMPLFASARLKSVIDSTFPLAEAAKAHQRMASRENFGKVVLVL